MIELIKFKMEGIEDGTKLAKVSILHFDWQDQWLIIKIF